MDRQRPMKTQSQQESAIAEQNDRRTRIAPSDLRRLQARAVMAEVIAGEQPGNVAEAAADEFSTEPRKRDVVDAEELQQLTRALHVASDPENKADLLALISDVSDRTGTRIRQIIAEALRPNQPLEVQRQALYLAIRYNPGLVQAIASKADHPLQQDAEAFLLERELEQGRRPAPVDQPDTAVSPSKSPGP